MSEGPAPGPCRPVPVPPTRLCPNAAPPGAQGRVSGHFRISPHPAAESHQPAQRERDQLWWFRPAAVRSQVRTGTTSGGADCGETAAGAGAAGGGAAERRTYVLDTSVLI